MFVLIVTCVQCCNDVVVYNKAYSAKKIFIMNCVLMCDLPKGSKRLLLKVDCDLIGKGGAAESEVD